METFTGTTEVDSAAASQRAGIDRANLNAGDGMAAFADDIDTITLPAAVPSITVGLIIDDGGSETVDGNTYG